MDIPIDYGRHKLSGIGGQAHLEPLRSTATTALHHANFIRTVLLRLSEDKTGDNSDVDTGRAWWQLKIR